MRLAFGTLAVLAFATKPKEEKYSFRVEQHNSRW